MESSWKPPGLDYDGKTIVWVFRSELFSHERGSSKYVASVISNHTHADEKAHGRRLGHAQLFQRVKQKARPVLVATL